MERRSSRCSTPSQHGVALVRILASSNYFPSTSGGSNGRGRPRPRTSQPAVTPCNGSPPNRATIRIAAMPRLRRFPPGMSPSGASDSHTRSRIPGYRRALGEIVEASDVVHLHDCLYATKPRAFQNGAQDAAAGGDHPARHRGALPALDGAFHPGGGVPSPDRTHARTGRPRRLRERACTGSVSGPS